MTFQTGSATDLVDLLDKLSIFATTTHGGWTQGYLNTTNGWFELHKGNLSVSFKWYPSDPTTLSIHHATGFAGTSTAPGKHTNDSNVGYDAVDIFTSVSHGSTERGAYLLGDGPFPNYWFFADDTDNDYIHVVVESEPTIYRHFGFGTLNKIGDNWTGGEYVYGHYKVQSTNTTSAFNNASNMFLMDSPASGVRCPTIYMPNFPGQPSGSLYGLCWGARTSWPTTTDAAGNPHGLAGGGSRQGLFGLFMGMTQAAGALHVPLAPIHTWAKDVTNKHAYLLGTQPDAFMCNMSTFQPGQEFTIGSDTYIAFPAAQKTSASTVNRTHDAGYAYRKVT